MTYYIIDTITNTIYTHKSIHYADNLCRCTRAQHTQAHTKAIAHKHTYNITIASTDYINTTTSQTYRHTHTADSPQQHS